MDKLIIATNNAGKVKEIKAILNGLFENIVSLKDEGIQLDVVEDGASFEENAVKKSKEAAHVTGCYSLADDSGICVDHLNGAPGIYSARFAGENATDEQNNQKLAELLADLPLNKRRAHYACVMALCDPRGNIVTAYGEVEGFLIPEPAGSNGFGYDPYFYLPAYGLTMAQLDSKIKNSISHRFLALQALKEKLLLKK
jgi:XTP/dITP diphosphohydrolase